MFSTVFLFQVSPLLKVPKKFLEKYTKINIPEASRRAREGPEGIQGGQTARGRGQAPGRARGAPRAPGPPLDAPFRLFIPRDEKPSETEPFFTISPLYRYRRASKIGSTRRPLP